MSLNNLESLIIVLIFVIPGFAAHYTSEYLSPVPGRYKELGALDKTLISIVNSTIVILAESVTFWFILTCVGYQFRYNLSLIIKADSLLAFLTTDPTLYFFLSTCWILLSIIGGFVLGAFDPLDSVLRNQLHKSTILRETDVWYNVVENRRRSLNSSNPIWARIQTENEDILEGYLVDYSLKEREDGSRDLALQLGSFLAKGQQPIDLSEQTMLALVNTAQTRTIIVTYQSDFKNSQEKQDIR